MSQHVSKIVIVTLLVAVVGLPFLLRPSAGHSGPAPADADGRLVIITPHNEQIRYEMERGFNRWRIEQGLRPVAFDWRTSGGTSDLRKGILAQYEAKARRDQVQEGIGADLFFGGGDYDHSLIARGVNLGSRDEPDYVRIAEQPRLPDGLFEQVYPRPDIGGEPLYHPDRLWLGVALSSFGIVYNRDVLQILQDIEGGDVHVPDTWGDLAEPTYRGWVAMSDPAHSGSIATALNTVIARTGWTEGWALLRRVFANARYFASASSKIPVDVSQGDAAAGICIDFYGRYQAGAVAVNGVSRVGYVDPLRDGVSLTATSADPILLLRGAPQRELAERFIAWLLSESAQHLWQKRVGSDGGPERFELRRMPIRADLYTPKSKADWVDREIDPYASAAPLPPGLDRFRSMVSPVSHALAIDVHGELRSAWEAILRTPDDHPDKPEMLRLFDEMPPELTLRWPDVEMQTQWRAIIDDPDHPRHAEAVDTLKHFAASLKEEDRDQRLRDELRWKRFFSERYRKIAEMARD